MNKLKYVWLVTLILITGCTQTQDDAEVVPSIIQSVTLGSVTVDFDRMYYLYEPEEMPEDPSGLELVPDNIDNNTIRIQITPEHLGLEGLGSYNLDFLVSD